MDVADLRRRFVDAGLEKVADQLLGLIEPSVRLVAERTDEASISIAGTKLGGQPDLPAGTQWPSFRTGPLSFIAQLNLRDVQGLPGTERLPTAGLLSFFYDGEQSVWGFDPADRGGWLVTLSDADAPLHRLAFPTGLADSSRFAACRLRPQLEPTLAPWEFADVAALGLDLDQCLAYSSALPELEDGHWIHRLLGHPDPIQGNMQLEAQLASHGLYCGDASGYEDPRGKLLQHGANDWRLLLQIDSEELAGMMWGDVGRIYYWMHRDDLAQRRFDRAWCILQCS